MKKLVLISMLISVITSCISGPRLFTVSPNNTWTGDFQKELGLVHHNAQILTKTEFEGATSATIKPHMDPKDWDIFQKRFPAAEYKYN